MVFGFKKREAEDSTTDFEFTAPRSGESSLMSSMCMSEDDRGSILETEQTMDAKGNPMVKFKMMMIGDLSAGKSDMLAKYFGKNAHEMFMSLTEGGMIQESRTVQCCKKSVQINCLDTTQNSANPDMFRSLIKG